MLDCKGIIPAIVTPFKDDETQIDEVLLRREIRYMLDVAKVHGITVTGSTGEGQTLSVDEVRYITEVTLDEAGKDVPVITGVIANSTCQAIKYAKAVRDLPIRALQVTPVHYVFNPTDDGQVNYYKDIADAFGKPIILYNVVPWANLSAPLVERIFDEVELVQGIKQSGRDIHKLAILVESLKGKGMVYSAIDNLLYSTFCLGADGTISASPSILPDLSVKLWDAVQAGNHELALDIHRKILPVWNAVDAPDMPARLKEAINLQGRPVGNARKPFLPVKPEVREQIRKALKFAGVI